eukprot:g11344.t1
MQKLHSTSSHGSGKGNNSVVPQTGGATTCSSGRLRRKKELLLLPPGGGDSLLSGMMFILLRDEQVEIIINIKLGAPGWGGSFRSRTTAPMLLLLCLCRRGTSRRTAPTNLPDTTLETSATPAAASGTGTSEQGTRPQGEEQRRPPAPAPPLRLGQVEVVVELQRIGPGMLLEVLLLEVVERVHAPPFFGVDVVTHRIEMRWQVLITVGEGRRATPPFPAGGKVMRLELHINHFLTKSDIRLRLRPDRAPDYIISLGANEPVMLSF